MSFFDIFIYFSIMVFFQKLGSAFTVFILEFILISGTKIFLVGKSKLRLLIYSRYQVHTTFVSIQSYFNFLIIITHPQYILHSNNKDSNLTYSYLQ